jgi:hypothetical protein
LGKGGTINHLGVEVTDIAIVHRRSPASPSEGLFTDEEIGTTCRFAAQEKSESPSPRETCDAGVTRPRPTR